MKGCRPLTNKEIVLVENSFTGIYRNRNILLFQMGIYTGFRISELLSLTIGDVWTGLSVSDFVSVTRSDMKGNYSGRTVILNYKVKRVIEKYIKTLSNCYGEVYLFQSRKGNNKPMTRQQADRVLKKVFSQLGLTGKLATHSMRKTFANNIYNLLDHDIVKTQHALGHKNILSTIKYLQVDNDSINQAILSL